MTNEASLCLPFPCKVNNLEEKVVVVVIIFILIYVQEFREDEIKGIEHCTYRRKRYYIVAIKKLRAEMKNKNNF